MIKNNQDVARINQVSDPNAGTSIPARKLPDDELDSLHQGAGISAPETCKDAVESPGVAKRCLDAQLGRGDKSMSKTGGKLGDATNHPQSGGDLDDLK